MAVNWCQHVDGVTIFPKLPVYLRTHHTAWTRNQRVKEAVRKAVPSEAVLARLNEKTRQELLPEPVRPYPAVYLARFASKAAAALAFDYRARHLGRSLNFPSANFLSFAQHAPMPAAVHPAEGDDVLMVGGVNVGQLPVHTKRAHGQRGGDTKPRVPRSCRACKDAARPGASSCQGSSGRGKCPHSAGS